jgi:hypothetical protein
MDLSKREQNEIELYYAYCLIELIKHIDVLISCKRQKNKPTSQAPSQATSQATIQSTDKLIRLNKKKERLKELNPSSTEPTWHYHLIQAYYTLSGDYPDSECENHAYMYGDSQLKYIYDEIEDFPIDVLQDISEYIHSHNTTGKCSVCDMHAK